MNRFYKTTTILLILTLYALPAKAVEPCHLDIDDGVIYSLQKITRDVDGLAKTEQYCFSDKHLLMLTEDYRGNQYKNYWDDLLRLQVFEDPNAQTRTFAYNDSSQIESITGTTQDTRLINGAPNVEVKSYQYDSIGRVTQIDEGPAWAPLATYHVGTSLDDELSNVTGPLGTGSQVTSRDNAGRPLTIQHGDCNAATHQCQNALGSQTIEYDNVGRVLKYKNALGKGPEILSRNPFGQVTEIKMPSGQVAHYQYNHAGYLTDWSVQKTDDPNSYIMSAGSSTYNVMGMKVSDTVYVIGPQGEDPNQGLVGVPTQTTTYDLDESVAGQIKTESVRTGTQGQDVVLTTYLDGIGRITSREVSEQPDTTFTYNDNINQRQIQKVGLPGILTLDDNNLGQTTKVTTATGLERDYTYDSRGLVTKIEQDNNHDLQIYSDGYGRSRIFEKVPANPTDPSYEPSHVDYDAAGRVSVVRGDRNEDWEWQYNYGSQNWLSSLTDPLDNQLTFDDYNTVGLVAAITDANGTIVHYTYDDADRLTEITATTSGGTIYRRHFAYDDLGRVEWIGEAQGANNPLNLRGQGACNNPWSDMATGLIEADFDYDSLSRLVKENNYIKDCASPVVATFNTGNKLATLTYPGGNVINYDYTNAGYLTETEVLSSAQGNPVIITENYVYDAMTGRYNQITHDDGSVTDLTYDNYGRITKIEREDMAQALIALEETKYNPNSNPIAKHLEIGVNDASAKHFQQLAWDLDSRLAMMADIDLASFQAQPVNSFTNHDPDNLCLNTYNCFTLDTNNNRTFQMVGSIVREFNLRADESVADEIEHQGCSDMRLQSGLSTCNNPSQAHYINSYDNNGNLTAISDNGNVLKRFIYDAFNRLMIAALSDTEIVVYEYDGLDRLVRRREFTKNVAFVNWNNLNLSLGIDLDDPNNGNDYTFVKGDHLLWRRDRIIEIHHAFVPNPGQMQTSATSLAYGLTAGPVFSIDDQNNAVEHIRHSNGSLAGIFSAGAFSEWYLYESFGDLRSAWTFDINQQVIALAADPSSNLLFRSRFRDTATGYDFAGGGNWFDSKRGRTLSRLQQQPSVALTNLYQSIRP